MSTQTNTSEYPRTIDELLTCPDYAAFAADKLGNDLFINDPERADRIAQAAEHGGDGSLHCEVIQDWREFADHVYDGIRRDAEDEDEHAIDRAQESLAGDINDVEAYHETEGTLFQKVG